MNLVQQIAQVHHLPERAVIKTIELLEEGATVPFIARYRKERTGGLDEVQLYNIQELKKKLEELEKRKNTILESIESQGKLSPELEQRIKQCSTSSVLEDLYLPYRPKRKTRASMAVEKGLEGLAKVLMTQREEHPKRAAQRFLNADVSDVEAALQGARDIMAEWISENARTRQQLRHLFNKQARIKSKVARNKEKEAAKYRDYFDFEQDLNHCPSHRFLAILRGEQESFLRVSIAPDPEEALYRISKQWVKSNNASSEEVTAAAADSYKRLLLPSLETEFRKLSKEKADQEAIKVFADNLQQLLLAAPLGEKRILAIDPGFRTGCKTVCLDAQGQLLENATIYPNPPQNDYAGAQKTIDRLMKKYQIEAIAIGNGTASRETDAFIRNLESCKGISTFVVSEQGASIYSASKIAREEFPDQDVTVRGAVSIGRRLLDPLAELVKIDPKSIGVGQYQHDVDQGQLRASLQQVVETCVNKVGVNLNTASASLLTYIAGLGPKLAQSIVEFRDLNGPFNERKQLKKVPRLGDKAFEQCAGFLRIRNGKNPLDNSAVHPESYGLVKLMATDLNAPLASLIGNSNKVKQLRLDHYISGEVGLPTLQDIQAELLKPGLDPRGVAQSFQFAQGIHAITDLREGMELPGIVTNITKFGAFVDIGIKGDGLVHISEMANRFVKDPQEVVKLHQKVSVRVIGIDLERQRVNLSMK
ncbi:MAG: Tex family protein [Bacteroidota bacterium]